MSYSVFKPRHNSFRYYEPNKAPLVFKSLDQMPEKSKNGMLWLSLQDPSDEELQQLLPHFVQPRVIEEMQTRHLRPKVVEYEGASLVVAISFHLKEARVSFGESQLLFGEGFLISVWRNTVFNDVNLQQTLGEGSELIFRGADYLVAEILDMITDEYTDELVQIEEQVEDAEASFFIGRSKNTDIEKVYRLRRILLRVQSCIGPLSELSRRFTRQNSSYIGEASRVYFAEVADRIARQAEWAGALRETLAFAFEAGMIIVQLQQNDIMRKLAAWAGIIAIPTAVAGIYGMNFINMPELGWSFGYPVVLGTMGAVCGGLYMRFKRMKWL